VRPTSQCTAAAPPVNSCSGLTFLHHAVLDAITTTSQWCAGAVSAGTFQSAQCLTCVCHHSASSCCITPGCLLTHLLFRLLLPCSDLPGLIDLLFSAIWSTFFLSAGASLLSWGGCKSDSLCLSWNGTIGVCFFLFIVYAITAVCAALDLRAQIQALKGTPPGVQTGRV